MRKKITTLLAGLLLLLTCTNIALAVDIPISITIPAIPGLNVPMIEEQSVQTNNTPMQENTANLQDANATATTQQSKPIIKEEEKTTTLIEQQVQQEKVLIFVKTFYER